MVKQGRFCKDGAGQLYEKRADELDERAEKLRKLSEMKEEYGFLWVVFSIAAGIVLAPFTGGDSLFVGLLSAGIVSKFDFDSHDSCEAASAQFKEAIKKHRDDTAELSEERDQLRKEKNNLLFGVKN